MSVAEEIYYITGCYCSICDMIFSTEEGRSLHLQTSLAHPSCDKCSRRFPDNHGLRTHFVVSREHHYCPSCQVHFKSAAGLGAHKVLSAAHRKVENHKLPIVDEGVEGWEEIFGKRFFSKENAKFERLKHSKPPVVEEEIWAEDDELDYDEDQELYHSIRPSPPPEENPWGQDALPADKCNLSVCPMCVSPLGDHVSVTKCGHVFCNSCIERSLEKRKSCPVCKKPAVVDRLRNLYLF